MQLCTLHWADLKTALDERGLTKFISKDGGVAIKALVAATSGAGDTFDPLMQASIMIMAQAIQSFGQEIMAEDAPCPLCALDYHAAHCTAPGCKNETGADWVRFAADEQLSNAKQMGLIGEPN
jgi:hypothetical protein